MMHASSYGHLHLLCILNNPRGYHFASNTRSQPPHAWTIGTHTHEIRTKEGVACWPRPPTSSSRPHNTKLQLDKPVPIANKRLVLQPPFVRQQLHSLRQQLPSLFCLSAGSRNRQSQQPKLPHNQLTFIPSLRAGNHALKLDSTQTPNQLIWRIYSLLISSDFDLRPGPSPAKRSPGQEIGYMYYLCRSGSKRKWENTGALKSNTMDVVATSVTF